MGKNGISVGLIGAGGIAHQHMAALVAHPGVSSVALADVSDNALVSMSEKYKVSRVVTDYRRLLDDPEIDCVDICLPHWLHHQVSIEAFDAGKHVIVEKPISMTLAEADDMICAAQRSGKRLYTSMNMLFMPAHREAKRLIDAGEIGSPFMAVFKVVGNEFKNMNDPTHWKGTWDKAGGGVLIDTGMHFIYLSEYYFGRPRRVTAATRRLVVSAENKAEDTAVFVLEYEGALVSHTMTYSATGTAWRETWEIVGTQGSIKGEHGNTAPLMVTHEKQPRTVELATFEEGLHSGSVRRSVTHAIDCLLEGRPFEFSAEDARSALEVALAAYESAKSGRRVELDAKGTS